MKLKGSELEAIQTALLDSYNLSELEQMVRIGLGVDLDDISIGGSLSENIFKLIEWAEKHDKVNLLIEKAHLRNPGNYELNRLYSELKTAGFHGIPEYAKDETPVTIILLGDYIEFTDDKKVAFVEAISNLLDVSPERICLSRVVSGSIVVTLLMPDDAAKRFYQLAQQGNEKLKQLKILAVSIEGQPVAELGTKIHEERKKPFYTSLFALLKNEKMMVIYIPIIVALIALLGNYITGWFIAYAVDRPIHATETAEAKGTLQAVLSLVPTFTLTPSLTSTVAPTVTFTPTLTDTPTPTTLASEPRSLVVVLKLEDRSKGSYQGEDPTQVLYTQIGDLIQKSGLPMDILRLDLMPQDAALQKMAEKNKPILFISGSYDTATVAFHMELFSVVSQSGGIYKTDEFDGAFEFPSHLKYISQFTLGLECYVTGYHDRAVDYLSEALLAVPDGKTVINPADAYFLRGLSFHALGKLDRAIGDYSMAIQFNPGVAEFYNSRGAAYDDLQEEDQAIADYDVAIQLKPDTPNYYNNRGNAYAHKGLFTKAILDYTKAIELKSDDADYYRNRADSYADIKDYVHAIADYTQAILLRPDFSDAYNNRGAVYYDMGEIDHAIADYTKAINLEPKYADAYSNRGNAYRQKGEFDLAIEDLNHAILLAPGFINAYFNRGLTYKQMGHPEEAIADFRKVLELNPSPDVKRMAEDQLRELGVK